MVEPLRQKVGVQALDVRLRDPGGVGLTDARWWINDDGCINDDVQQLIVVGNVCQLYAHKAARLRD